MRVVLGAAVVALALLGSARTQGVRADGQQVAVRLSKATWKTPLWAPAGMSNVLPAGEAVACGPWSLTVTTSKSGAEAAWTGPGKTGQAKLKRGRPRLLKLGKGEHLREVLLFDDALGRWRAVSASVRMGEVAGRRVAFLDADYDGTWLEPGVDWIAAEGARHALLCEERIVLGNHEAALQPFDAQAKEMRVALTDVSAGISEAEREAHAVLNDVRLHHGLPGAVVDAPRSAACRLHAKWCALNGRMEHSEPKGSPGYSDEGEAAAHASLIWRGRTPTAAFFGLLDTPMHGYPLTAPWYTRTAIGWHEGYLVIWWHEGDEFPLGAFDERHPAVFPPDGAAGVPIDWHGEIPDPRQGDTSKPWGYPLRVYLRKRFRAYFLAVSDVQARLVPHGTDEEVPLQVSDDPLDFWLLPRVALKPKTTYHLTLSWTERKRGPRSLESTFTTGSQSGQRRRALER